MALKPRVVITGQYYPACIAAFLYAKIAGCKHVCLYDGWQGFDRHLSFYHRWLRRLFYRNSDAFIGVSSHTRKLFESYGVDVSGRFFWSPLVVDNRRFFNSPEAPKRYDILLSGRFVDTKLPEFTVRVLGRIKQSRPGLSVLIIGNGDKLEYVREGLRAQGIEVTYPGFIQQEDLPSQYRQARLLLMPTKGDCWGLVANEAMAVGVPVITTPYAGVKDDLVKHGENGFVLPEVEEDWARESLRLLEDTALYDAFSRACRPAVEPYTFENAAKGIVEAVRHCEGGTPGRSSAGF
jgi:glycosyltransferase involved in cell wall biosynthesis